MPLLQISETKHHFLNPYEYNLFDDFYFLFLASFQKKTAVLRDLTTFKGQRIFIE